MEAMYRVNRGVYKGKSGAILQETPRRVRLTLADGQVTGYIPRESLLNPPTFASAAPTPHKPVHQLATPAVQPTSSPGISTPRTPVQPAFSENNTPAQPPVSAGKDPKTPGFPKLEEFEEVISEDTAVKLMPTPAALSEKFEPPMLLTDPSVVAGVSAVVFDMMDGTPVVATVMAIVVFFLFRVASLPARVVMASDDWLKANWFLVNGCWALHEAVSFVALHHDHTGEDTENSTAKFYDMCILSFGVMPLCFMTYMGLVQCRPERYSSELLTAVFMLLRVSMQLTGLLPVSRDVTAFLDNAEQLGGPYARIGVWTAITGVYGHVTVLCALSAWRNIRNKFAQGSGW